MQVGGAGDGSAVGHAGCGAGANRAEPRPWEGFNRAVFQFNDTIDRYALKPAAQGYRFVMPDLAEQGVSNFFDNLGDLGVLANNLLQLKLHDAASDTARITMNTIFGLGGVFDLATPFGLEKHNEDFGQTLGYWGVASGNYLVLPLFGPSTVRDGIGLIPDSYLDPVGEVDHIPTRNSLYGLRLVDTRAGLLKAEEIISGDRYLFIRDAYLQRREYLINDGRVDSQFDADDF
ncbi:VacJ family lipoprotein [Marinobacterium aestuariivivens]|uniref:VacJ family lipoprotein n=1 Tax=Marinobacterium aestuariivivens TaxID=1698799 RepID=A0ABW1ZU53_9GAMM